MGMLMRFNSILMVAALAALTACAGAPPDSTGSAAGNGAAGANGGYNASAAGTAGANQGQIAGRAAPGSEQELKQTVGDRIFFSTDKSDISAEARTTLQRQAEWLKRYPNIIVSIEGHCDERGTREYNLALGARRAEAAKQVLVALGIDPGRMTTITYGKERPAVVGSNEAAWAQNRRAVTVVQ